MRPPEQDVTLTLYQLDCAATEDSGDGDEPYLWILGFKVDADTLGPPPAANPLVPSLNVHVFEGTPASPFPLGPNSLVAPASVPIQPGLGTRAFRLRPAHLDIGGWFPGLAGVICLLWDQDGFSPSTSEAGFNRFKKVFGPALSGELNNLMGGTYDGPLSRDADGNPVPIPPSGQGLAWRLDRLGDPAGRANAVSAITAALQKDLTDQISDAVAHAAGLDELIDPDDLLGVQAQVWLGTDLRSPQDFTMRFTGDDADYTAHGHAYGTAVHRVMLDSAVSAAHHRFDRSLMLSLKVCWFAEKQYMASASWLRTTTRFSLRDLVGGPPTAVRWILDGKVLADGHGSVLVKFEGADAYTGPPQHALAGYYTGGPAILTYRTAGAVLEITNEGGAGMYFGTVQTVFGFDGDPSIHPPPATPVDQLLASGYSASAQLSITGIELTMDSTYRTDLSRCMQTVKDIDRKHIAVDLGAPIDPGDPLTDREQLLDRVSAEANAVRSALVQPVRAPSIGAGVVAPRVVTARIAGTKAVGVRMEEQE